MNEPLSNDSGFLLAVFWLSSKALVVVLNALIVENKRYKACTIIQIWYYIYIEVTNQTTKKETATAMIHLYLDLVPESYSSTMDIIEFAQRVYTPDQDDVLEDLESEVWAEMRKDDEMPDFSEIYIKVVNNRGLGLLQTILPDANIQFDTDGSITIDGSSIYDSSYLTDAVSQYREDNTDEDEDEHED